MLLFAENMQLENKMFDAAVAYECANEYEMAIESYKSCMKGREALRLAVKAGWSGVNVVALAKELAGTHTNYFQFNAFVYQLIIYCNSNKKISWKTRIRLKRLR